MLLWYDTGRGVESIGIFRKFQEEECDQNPLWVYYEFSKDLMKIISYN